MKRKVSRQPTISDVAKAVGISASTVSRALNGKPTVAADTLERIRSAATQLSYRPNGVARSLAIRSTQTIGILVPEIANPFFGELVKGVQHQLEEHGYALLLGTTEQQPKKELAYLETLRRKLVDGVVLIGLVSGREALGPLLEGLPVVCLDREVDIPGMALVQVDNRLGAKGVTEHLVGLGHKRVAHLSGPRGLVVTKERQAGYRDAIESAGLVYDPELVAQGDFTEDSGHDATLELLRSGRVFSALFAANDLAAIGAMAAVAEHGLRVPADISVAGFDDIHLAAYVVPRLTTMRQPIYEMGRKAAELLVNDLQPDAVGRAKRIRLRGQLVVRESTGPPPAPREG